MWNKKKMTPLVPLSLWKNTQEHLTCVYNMNVSVCFWRHIIIHLESCVRPSDDFKSLSAPLSVSTNSTKADI